MIETTGLLGSAIYEIQEAWTGWKELQHANYVLKTLPKGLRFFCLVSPFESPKVIGLMGIHHQWGHPLPLVQLRRAKQGHHHQPLKDGALQVGPCMQEMFLLPFHHVGGHLAPQLEELPAFIRGRSQ